MKYLVVDETGEREVDCLRDLISKVRMQYKKVHSAFYYPENEKTVFTQSAIQSPGQPKDNFIKELKGINAYEYGTILLCTFDRSIEMAEHLCGVLEMQIEHEVAH